MTPATAPYQFVDMDPRALIDDVYNAVHDFACDGIDAMETTFRNELHARGQVVDDMTSKAISRGLDQLLTRLEDSTEKSMERFEQYSMAHCFHIPSALTLEEPSAASMSPVSADKEAVLDSQLRELRRKLAVIRGRTSEMKSEAAALEREMDACSGVDGKLRAVVAGKENPSVAEDATAIAAAAVMLQGLLERAEAVQSSGSVIPNRGGATEAAAADKEVRQRRSAAGGATNREVWSLTTRLRV